MTDAAPNVKDIRVYLLRNADLAQLADPEFSNRYAVQAGLDLNRYADHPEVQEYLRIADGFGTTITLSVPGDNINAILELARRLDVPHGRVTDAAYPIGDGFTAPDPQITFGWLLGDASDWCFRQLTHGWSLAG